MPFLEAPTGKFLTSASDTILFGRLVQRRGPYGRRNRRMMNVYIATYSIDIVALLYLLTCCCSSNILENRRKKSFLFAIVLAIVIIMSEAGTLLANDGAIALRGVSILCNVLGFGLTPAIPLALITISDFTLLDKHKWLLWPTWINLAAAVLSIRFKWIFSVDADNHYGRGNFFFIFVVVYIVNLLLLLIGTLRMGKKYRYPIQRKMIVLSLLTIAGTSIQLVYPWIHSSWHCITFSLFLYFILLSEFDSSFDVLTGLFNRAAFEKAASQMTSPKGFSVIVLDINNFKQVNDAFGHNYGDFAIKVVAKILRESLDSRYSCYRAGGDEFYVIGTETDSEKIQDQLEKITEVLSKKRGMDGRLPTISYGYSVFHGGESPDFQEILRTADYQMYCFKRLKRDLPD